MGKELIIDYKSIPQFCDCAAYFCGDKKVNGDISTILSLVLSRAVQLVFLIIFK